MDRGTKRRWEVGVGLVALALLAGLAWALRDSGSLGVGGASERFVIPYAPDLDLTAADRSVPVGDLIVEVTISPRPIRPLATQQLRLRVTRGEAGATPPPAVEDVELAFNMKMDMGRHVYHALPDGDAWRADVVLPGCGMGGERWYARLRVTADGERREAVVLFDVAAHAPGP